MNISQAFVNLISNEVLAAVFDGDEKINLREISQVSTAPTKLGSNVRPDYDSTLRDLGNEGLFSKESSTAVFDRELAEQIARSKAVINSRLTKTQEFDETITFGMGIPEEDETLTIDEAAEILVPEFLLDIYYHDNIGSAKSRYDNRTPNIIASTYNKPLFNVNNYYYGHSLFEDQTRQRDYPITDSIIGLDETRQTSDITIGDGAQGTGLTLASNVPGLQNAIQTHNHINALIEMRIVFVREGKILVGPIRAGLFKIDGATQVINNEQNQNIIKLTIVKTWDNITQIAGIRTADSYLKSFRPNDGFFRHSSNANLYKTFKEDN